MSAGKPQIIKILEEVNEHVLAYMTEVGWYSHTDNVQPVSCNQPLHAARHDKPTPADINGGFCEMWADEALRALKKAGIEGTGDCVWIEDRGKEWQEFAHCVLFFDGKYYDSETLDGAKSINGIKMVKDYTPCRPYVKA